MDKNAHHLMETLATLKGEPLSPEGARSRLDVALNTLTGALLNPVSKEALTTLRHAIQYAREFEADPEYKAFRAKAEAYLSKAEAFAKVHAEFQSQARSAWKHGLVVGG